MRSTTTTTTTTSVITNTVPVLEDLLYIRVSKDLGKHHPGPLSYVINALDLSTVTSGNLMYEYTLMTLMLSFQQVVYRTRVADWARENSLTLNRTKSTEIAFTDSRRNSVSTHPTTIIYAV